MGDGNSSQNVLQVQVGKAAAQKLAEYGWRPELFSTMLGASGGPKWLILAAMDRVLHRRLLVDRTTPINLVGSSIGTWRHACLAQPNPEAAITRFEDAYIGQSYSEKPTPDEVSRVATDILNDALGEDGPARVAEHAQLRSHIVTARAMGVARGRSKAAVSLGMGTAALGNAMHRSLLSGSFQRVVFGSQGEQLSELFGGFTTHHVNLTANNVVSALKASGAIPLVLSPEISISGAPPGNYWDGGIVDYHFALPETLTSGLLLYPHFTDTLTPGWFDKFLPWRRGKTPACDHLVMLSPAKALIESLPYGKIPDRNDFARLSTEERQRYWRICLSAGEQMADALEALIDSDDPLAGVETLSS